MPFASFGGFRELEITASVEGIGDGCFRGSCSLSRLTFASGSVLKSIGKEVFRGCKLCSAKEFRSW